MLGGGGMDEYGRVTTQRLKSGARKAGGTGDIVEQGGGGGLLSSMIPGDRGGRGSIDGSSDSMSLMSSPTNSSVRTSDMETGSISSDDSDIVEV